MSCAGGWITHSSSQKKRELLNAVRGSFLLLLLLQETNSPVRACFTTAPNARRGDFQKTGRIIVIIMESSEVRGRGESRLGARNEDLEKAAERFGLK